MQLIGYITTVLVAYLLGSIPTGFLVGKARGLDIRKVGSGNIGATNVFRSLGKGLGALVMAVDVAKGYAACQVVARLGRYYFFPTDPDQEFTLEVLGIIAGIAAILGHNYTCWLNFKGGKGVATTGGVLLGLLPGASAISFGVWLVVLALTRYVSVASIAAAISLPLGVWCSNVIRHHSDKTLIIVAAALGALGIYKHKANIQRLCKGTEHRFGKKKDSESTQ